jgi:hypothetical protein
MSKFEVSQTTFTDQSHLVGALTEMGFTPEVYDNPVHLYGHYGDERPDVAHVVIRRDQIHFASNDVGFVRGEDGIFRAIVSEFDRGFVSNSIGMALDDTWIGRLKKLYQVRKAKQVGMERGYRFLGQEEFDGKTRLRWEVPEQSTLARLRSMA